LGAAQRRSGAAVFVLHREFLLWLCTAVRFVAFLCADRHVWAKGPTFLSPARQGRVEFEPRFGLKGLDGGGFGLEPDREHSARSGAAVFVLHGEFLSGFVPL